MSDGITDAAKQTKEALKRYPIPNDEQCRICSQATREKVYDELGVLYGESAKKFQEYMDAPPTEADREMSKRAYEIIERDRIEAEKPIRKDEREKVLGKLEVKILTYMSKLPGGTKYPGLVLALEMIEEVKDET